MNQWLWRHAPESVEWVACDKPGLMACKAHVPFPDGSPSIYSLEIFDGDPPRVREVVKERRLPAICYERHITQDGFFCLGWDPQGARRIDSQFAAEAWWAELLGFLYLQDIASASGEWSDKNAWPHGLEAARYQSVIDAFSQAVPKEVVSAVSARTLLPSDTRFTQIANRRRPCPCGSNRPIKSCHEKEALALGMALKLRDDAVDRFWRSVKSTGQRCCGTMRSCPLRDLC